MMICISHATPSATGEDPHACLQLFKWSNITCTSLTGVTSQTLIPSRVLPHCLTHTIFRQCCLLLPLFSGNSMLNRTDQVIHAVPRKSHGVIPNGHVQVEALEDFNIGRYLFILTIFTSTHITFSLNLNFCLLM